MKYLLLALILLTLALSAQPPYQEVQEKSFFRSKYPQKFPLLFRPYPVYQADGRYCVYFPVELQHKFLQFVREGERYTSTTEIDVNIIRQDTVLVTNRAWQTVAETGGFESTLSRSLFHFTIDSLYLPPGEYDVLLKYRDLNSEQKLTIKQRLVLPRVEDYYAFPPLFSRPDALPQQQFSFVGGAPSPRFGHWDFNRELGFFLQTWRKDPSLPGKVQVELVNERREETVYSSGIALSNDLSIDFVRVAIPRELLLEGVYRLTVTYRFGNAITQHTLPVTVIWFDRPLSLWDPELAVSPLQYVLSEEDYQILTSGEREAQMQRLRAYWKERDPTPETPYNELQAEFYTRVDSTLSLFSEGHLLGWRTPQGRVYILNGPPREIDDHSLDPIPNPYLRWIYYQDGKRVIYTFRAVDGRREYKLTDMAEETL